MWRLFLLPEVLYPVESEIVGIMLVIRAALGIVADSSYNRSDIFAFELPVGILEPVMGGIGALHCNTFYAPAPQIIRAAKGRRVPHAFLVIVNQHSVAGTIIFVKLLNRNPRKTLFP